MFQQGWGMRVMVLLSLLIFAGCDSPTPAVGHWQRATVVEGGMTFGLHWDRQGGQVEIYRTSKHLMPKLSEVSNNAKHAVRKATGCLIREGTLKGDVAILKGDLICP